MEEEKKKGWGGEHCKYSTGWFMEYFQAAAVTESGVTLSGEGGGGSVGTE